MGPAKLKIFDPGFIGSFFALIAAILAFLTLLTGVRPGDLLLFKVDAQNFRVPAKLSSSQLLADIETISGDNLTGNEHTADSLGLAKYYTIHILTYCSHFKDHKTCSDAQVGFWFDPVKILRLNQAGLGNKLEDDLVDAIKGYKHAANFIGIGFILAFMTITCALILSLFARRHRALNIIVATFASLGSAFLLADAVTIMTAARKMVNGLNNDLNRVGIEASQGFLIYLPFIAAALSLIASITYSTIAHRNRIAGASQRPGMQRKISVAVGHSTASASESRGFTDGGEGLLQRMSTWTRKGSYVQIEKQRPNIRVMHPPISEESAFLDPQDEVRFNQNINYSGRATPEYRDRPDQNMDYKHPSEQNNEDIAMQPLTKRDKGPNTSYEPYSNMI